MRGSAEKLPHRAHVTVETLRPLAIVVASLVFNGGRPFLANVRWQLFEIARKTIASMDTGSCRARCAELAREHRGNCGKPILGQRFHGSNHIRLHRQAYRTMCVLRD